MPRALKITAVCGWAISPVWFRALIQQYFPGSVTQALYPSNPADAGEAMRLLQENAGSDLYIGYSLGSLWLFHHRRFLPPIAHKAALAPILGFEKRDNMGGKTVSGQLKYLMRSLKRSGNGETGVRDFYMRCELPPPAEYFKELPDILALVRGLDFLGNFRAGPESAMDFTAIAGDQDPFIDTTELQRHIPHLHVIPNAGHGPEILLRRLAELILPPLNRGEAKC